jgi:hypothetical protein
MRLHHDQQGSISVVSVIGLLLLVFLLGMVMNSGQQIDQKVKMQNAADAATYSGGVVLTRGMNTLSFTNHLLFDVFALTAFHREGGQRNAEGLTPEILDNWERIGPIFAESQYQSFARLGPAITEKVPQEREMVRTFSEWAAAASELMLPTLEGILAERLIPEYQRALVESAPRLAQYAADEVAKRHGEAWPNDVTLRAVMWRTNGQSLDGDGQSDGHVLPVVDPVMDAVGGQQDYLDTARDQREQYANTYLRTWNNDTLRAFDSYGKMSQFANLWRIFTCGHLKQLLEEEYPDTNLPHVIRTEIDDIDDVTQHMHDDFSFVGIVYRDQRNDRVPGVFKNPIRTDTQAYAQIMVFVPRRRLIKAWPGETSADNEGEHVGGVPGEEAHLPVESDNEGGNDGGENNEEDEWWVVRQSGALYPESWNLLNQNWAMQMTPATSVSIPRILSTEPPTGDFQTPNLEELNAEDLGWLSNH